jgi:hypothetical protein
MVQKFVDCSSNYRYYYKSLKYNSRLVTKQNWKFVNIIMYHAACHKHSLISTVFWFKWFLFSGMVSSFTISRSIFTSHLVFPICVLSQCILICQCILIPTISTQIKTADLLLCLLASLSTASIQIKFSCPFNCALSSITSYFV